MSVLDFSADWEVHRQHTDLRHRGRISVAIGELVHAIRAARSKGVEIDGREVSDLFGAECQREGVW